jgi:hypothetical protein
MIDLTKINYVPFDLANLSLIQNEVASVYRRFIDDAVELTATPVEWSTTNLPITRNTINNHLEKLGATVTRARLFLTLPNSTMAAHIDGNNVNDTYWALNIPIEVEESNHWHEWYNYHGELLSNNNLTYTDYIRPANPNQLTVSDRLCFTTAHLVKVGTFHGVVNQTNYKRVMLSIRFSTPSIEFMLTIAQKTCKITSNIL